VSRGAHGGCVVALWWAPALVNSVDEEIALGRSGAGGE